MVFWSLVFSKQLLEQKKYDDEKKYETTDACFPTGLCGSFCPSGTCQKGVWRMVTLADGTQKRVELRGDEFCSYWVDAEGVSYNLDSESKRYVRVDANALKLRASQLRAKANQDRIERMAKARRMAAKKSLGQTNGSYFGKKKGLIILVQYKDKKFKFGHNQKMYNRIANETGYANSLGFVGSVKDYFLAQSNGQFELDFDVVGPYTLNHEYAYYGAPSGNSHDVRPCDMVYDACRLADPDVNFTDYDWDGDGYVEQVYVLFAGLGQAAGGDENTIWPHEYKLQEGNNGSYVSKDNNVVVNTYACGPELTLQYTPVAYRERVDGIGTLCHEFSHCLGYPDLYDTGNGGNFGMGEFDLMDAGSYNGESFCPPNYSAYEKWFAGWITPTVLDKPASVKGMQAQDVKYGQAFVVYNDNNKNEYYLIENRQQNVGIWDKQLPASGMMITHVDYDENIWERNNVNTIVNYSGDYAYLSNDHQRLTIFMLTTKRVLLQTRRLVTCIPLMVTTVLPTPLRLLLPSIRVEQPWASLSPILLRMRMEASTSTSWVAVTTTSSRVFTS